MFVEKEKSYFNPKTPDTNCKSVFLIQKTVFNGCLKIIGAQNLLPITFCSDLMRNKNALQARDSTPTHTNF